MDYLVTELLEFLGIYITDLYSFSELFVWFVTAMIGIELVLFVLDGIFYCIRSISRGMK